MAKKPENAAIEDIKEILRHLRHVLPNLSRPSATKAMTALADLINEIEDVRAELDPIKDPGASFDPGNPETAGRLVALALLAQDLVPMERIARTYGSGVYAIYYRGDHPAYAMLSRSETPIYVGKADPKFSDARTSREQGSTLYSRLADHRRAITTVGDYAIANNLPHPLMIGDFQCRRLVCATNAQLVAERHLISIFKPIWNMDVKICWGISKHGDSGDTRKNKRSPWDVMHPGRAWAMHAALEDKKTAGNIEDSIRKHFDKHPPQNSRVRLVRSILSTFLQNSASQSVVVDEDEEGLGT